MYAMTLTSKKNLLKDEGTCILVGCVMFPNTIIFFK